MLPILATAVIFAASALAQTNSATAAQPSSKVNSTIGTDPPVVIEFVYPQQYNTTVNVNDVIVFSWWENFTTGEAQWSFPVPGTNGGMSSEVVPAISTTAYTFAETNTQFPATETFDLAYCSPKCTSGNQYRIGVQVTVTSASTSAVPTTYAASTTGTSVVLPSASASPTSGATSLRTPPFKIDAQGGTQVGGVTLAMLGGLFVVWLL